LRKTILSALVAVLMFAGAGAALAEKPENPGEKGHCTAFFNGKKKGHGEEGSYPGPFQDLQDRAPDGSDDDDGDGDPAGGEEISGELEDLYDYCQSTYGIGGNGDENGRFTTCWTDDDADPDTHNCDD
jgi:hypothetical protein